MLFSPSDLQDLRHAKSRLERPGRAARLAEAIGNFLKRAIGVRPVWFEKVICAAPDRTMASAPYGGGAGAKFAVEKVIEVGAKTAVTTGGALALKEAGKGISKRVGSETLRKAAGSNVGTPVAFGVVETGIDAVQLMRGELAGREFAKRTPSTAGGLGAPLSTMRFFYVCHGPQTGSRVSRAISEFFEGFW